MEGAQFMTTALDLAASNAFAEAGSLGMHDSWRSWDKLPEDVRQAWRYIAEAAIRGMVQGVVQAPDAKREAA